MSLIGLRYEKFAQAACEWDGCKWQMEGTPQTVKAKARTHSTQNEHDVDVRVIDRVRYVQRKGG